MVKANVINNAAKADQARVEIMSIVFSLSEEARKELLTAVKYAMPYEGMEFKAKLEEKLNAYKSRQLAA